MSTPIYGLDKELAAKQAAKYDPQREEDVRLWIQQVTGESFPEPNDFQASLKDGVLLCKLLNILSPKNQVKFTTSSMPFKQMENISAFLKGAEALGCPKHELFQTIDLFEGKNIVQVIETMFSLGRNAQKAGFNGPILGPKLADKQQYSFTQEQLDAGKFVPTKQTQGSFGGATAAGISYGNRRDIINVANQEIHKPASNEPSLQTQGSVGGANQSNMGVSYGNRRDIIDVKNQDVHKPVSNEPSILNQGSVGGANQSNMGVSYGNRRQIMPEDERK